MEPLIIEIEVVKEARMPCDVPTHRLLQSKLDWEMAAHAAGMKKQRDCIQAIVDQQAEDEGLWFMAQTAPEAYLQEQLRLLHRVIEGQGQESEGK